MTLSHISPLRRHALAGALVLSLASFVSAADSPVIAKVGTDNVTLDQIKPFFSKLSDADRDALTKNPSALNQVVRKLIVQQLLYKEALANNWQNQPDVVAQLEQIKQNAIAETYLQSIAKVPDNYPSAAEVDAAYQAKKASLILPRQLQISQIFIPRPADLDQATADKISAKVQSIAKSLKQPGADFAAIMKNVSTDADLNGRGGDVGWISETDLQPEVRTIVSALPKGGVTDVIKLPEGWSILKVQDIKESRQATLDEIRDQLVKALRNERLRLNREAYLAKIQQQNPVSINELDLSQLISISKN